MPQRTPPLVENKRVKKRKKKKGGKKTHEREQTENKRKGVVVLDAGNDCEGDTHDSKEGDCNEPVTVMRTGEEKHSRNDKREKKKDKQEEEMTNSEILRAFAIVVREEETGRFACGTAKEKTKQKRRRRRSQQSQSLRKRTEEKKN